MTRARLSTPSPNGQVEAKLRPYDSLNFLNFTPASPPNHPHPATLPKHPFCPKRPRSGEQVLAEVGAIGSTVRALFA